MWPYGNGHDWHTPAFYPTGNEELFAPPNDPSSTFAWGITGPQPIFTPLPAHSNFLSSDTSSPAPADSATMSGTSQATKIGLDTRAAELKEKLLKGRSRIQARGNLAKQTTGSIASSTNAALVTPSAKSLSSDPSSERENPTSAEPVLHEAPAQPAERSIMADANDIAALISSISSSAAEIPGLNMNTTSTSVAPIPQTQCSMPANGRPSPPQNSPPKASALITAKQTVAAQSALPQLPKKQITMPGKPRANARSSAGNESLPEEGEITSTPKKIAVPRRSEDATSGTANLKTASLPTAAPKVNVAQPAAASSGRLAPAREEPDKNAAKPSARDAARDDSSATKPQPGASKPGAKTLDTAELPKAAKNNNSRQALSSLKDRVQTAPGKVPESLSMKGELPKAARNGNGRQASTNDKDAVQTALNKVRGSLSTEEAFTRLLSLVPDLENWLELTDYYNVESRTRKLDRFRRAKALAAEKLRIEEEERKLMEEEELETGLHRPTFARFTSAVPGAAADPESAGLLARTAPAANETKDAVAPIIPAKRPNEENGSNEAAKEKMPRLGEAPYRSRSGDADNRTKETDRREPRPGTRRGSPADRIPSRGSSPLRRLPPKSPAHRDYRRSPPTRPREHSPHRQPRPGPRFRPDYDGSDERPRKIDRYKSDSTNHLDSSRRRESGQHVSYPVRVDLGRKGDTRFFIMKSFNESNVVRCMEDGIWTTQLRNGPVLATAFSECKNVILFFSVNQSRAFQGYARMTTAPDAETPRPRWMHGIHWDSTDPFRVQWLSKTAVEFWRIGHLKNSYNQGAPVLVGKDGQEIEEECGAALLHEMEAFADEIKHHQQPPPPRTNSWSWGTGAGAYGGPRHGIKREATPERR